MMRNLARIVLSDVINCVLKPKDMGIMADGIKIHMSSPILRIDPTAVKELFIGLRGEGEVLARGPDIDYFID